MKSLLVVTLETPRAAADVQRRNEAAGTSPRGSLLEDRLHADVIDGYYLRALPRLRRALYRPLPKVVVQALEAFRLRKRYDAVVTWDDRVAVIYAALLMLTRSRSRHVALITWMAKFPKSLLLRLVQKRIDRIIVWSDVHRDLLCDVFGIAPSRVVSIPYQVDQQFWRPADAAQDSICAVGNSKRDYATLIDAVRGLPITCRIVQGFTPRPRHTVDWDETARSLDAAADLPANVVLGPAPAAELRAVYARARFVVVPLMPSFGNYGITAMLEAIAMGKAVICSDIRGHDTVAVEDGVNGILVPPGDVQGLREAIQYLWDHPEIAERMGREGRRRAEDVFALDHFVAHVEQIVEGVIQPEQAARHPMRDGRSRARVASGVGA